MNKWMKKSLSLLLAACMVIGMTACGSENDKNTNTDAAGTGRYTYTSGLGDVSTWSPTDWDCNDEYGILGYTTTPFYSMEINDTKDGYIFVPSAASEMPEDVTSEYAGSETYGVPSDATEGYAYKLALNEKLCWEDGTPITADDYLYTMQQYLNPDMKNFRASTFYDGTSSLANAKEYYNGSSFTYSNMNADGVSLDSLVKGDDGVYTDENGNTAYLGWTAIDNYWLGGYALIDWADYFDADSCELLNSLVNEDGYVPLTDESRACVESVISDSWGDAFDAYCFIYKQGEAIDFDQVGIVKNDDYSLTLIFSKQVSETDLCSAVAIELVKEDLYEQYKKDAGGLTKSSYGTSAEAFMSYGPYRIVSYQADKEMILTKNENWYGYQEGEYYADKYQTTDIDLQAFDDSSTKFSLFLQGKVSEVGLSSDQITAYANSDYIYYTPDTYVYCMFFNTDLETLKAEDGDGVNHSILSILDFRKAVSLCMNRSDFSQYMWGYKPCYGLLNEIYLCSLESGIVYRNTEQAEQALCDLYGMDSVDEITGYDLEEASRLFQSAYEQAIAEGLMSENDTVQIDYHAYGSDTIYQSQADFFTRSIQAACEGTDLEGKVTVNNVTDENNIANMRAGLCDMILTSWGGADTDPYWMMLCYCTEDWNLTYGYDVYSQTMTINVDGEDITMSAYDWYMALHETTYAAADLDTRNAILAGIEKQLLEYYGAVPLASSTYATLYSQRVVLGSEEYINSLVGYGGLSQLTYTMDDAEWEAYCASQNNQLTY